MKRSEIVGIVNNALVNISTANGYQVDFSKVTRWQETPTEYEENHLDFRDETAEYKWINNYYEAILPISITAVVFETTTTSAAVMGTIVLEDLMKAVETMVLCNAKFKLSRSHLYVETKGKTAAHVELEIVVDYKFRI